MSRISKAEATQRLQDQITKNGWKLLSPYVASKQKVMVRCGHGHQFQMYPTNIVNAKQGCPVCCTQTYSVYEAGMFYCVRWIHPETKHSFLKFGITNSTDYLKRIVVQGRRTDYEPEDTITVRFFIDGNAPKALERVMHDNLKTSYVTREVFGAGHTETVEDTESNIAFIKEMVW